MLHVEEAECCVIFLTEKDSFWVRILILVLFMTLELSARHFTKLMSKIDSKFLIKDPTESFSQVL